MKSICKWAAGASSLTIGITWAPTLWKNAEARWVIHDLVGVSPFGVTYKTEENDRELDVKLLRSIHDRIRTSWPNLKQVKKEKEFLNRNAVKICIVQHVFIINSTPDITRHKTVLVIVIGIS